MRPWPYARVVAHRGGGSLAPENTLAAIATGLARGFHAVEFDAMLPADETPILMHDSTLERTARVAGAVADWSSARLQTLDVGSWHSSAFAGEPVPTLAEALAYCRSHGVWPNIEIKPIPGKDGATGAAVARETARQHADLLRSGCDTAAAIDARIPLLSSFSREALLAARAAVCDLPRGLLVDDVPADWRDELESLGCVSLHANHAKLSADTVRAIKAAGYWIFCYTVNATARAREILSWGVDAFCTDRIDLIGPDFAAGSADGERVDE
jgi:glycerophosphoryl diester phosphodiesterase